MDARTWMKELDKGTVRPLYICYGPEKYRMREFIDYVFRKCVPDDLREFAVTKYDLSETSLDDVLEDALTMPFMAERKVILASNAAFLTGAKESTKVEHRPERLLDYMKSPADFSVVILTVDADKLDERKKIVKVLKDNGSMAPFVPLSADDLLQWVKRQADAFSFRLGTGAAEALLLSAGTDLQALRSELEKLSLYAGSGGTVSVEDVDGMIARTTEQDVFMLIDHIVRLRKEKAMTVFHELLLKKEEPIKIAALMTRQFRMLLQVKELERQGYSQQQMASQLGGHPYGIKIASEQGKRFSFEQLASILASLADLDYGMKTGRVEKTLGMELFILKLAV